MNLSFVRIYCRMDTFLYEDFKAIKLQTPPNQPFSVKVIQNVILLKRLDLYIHVTHGMLIFMLRKSVGWTNWNCKLQILFNNEFCKNQVGGFNHTKHQHLKYNYKTIRIIYLSHHFNILKSYPSYRFI